MGITREDDKIIAEIEEAGEKVFCVENKWVNHKRGKNYIAEIMGKDDQYKFDRNFLEHENIDGSHYYKISKFEEGRLYDIVFRYFTGSGNPNTKLAGLGVVKEINDEEIIFNVISEKEALNYVSQTRNVDAEIRENAKESIKKLADHAPEWETAEVIVRALREVEGKSEDHNLLKSLKKELEERLEG